MLMNNFSEIDRLDFIIKSTTLGSKEWVNTCSDIENYIVEDLSII